MISRAFVKTFFLTGCLVLQVVELEGLDVDVYYIGVWNTPIFGKNDAAFKLKVNIAAAKGEQSWVDEAEAATLELRVMGQQLKKLEAVFGKSFCEDC